MPFLYQKSIQKKSKTSLFQTVSTFETHSFKLRNSEFQTKELFETAIF